MLEAGHLQHHGVSDRNQQRDGQPEGFRKREKNQGDSERCRRVADDAAQSVNSPADGESERAEKRSHSRRAHEDPQAVRAAMQNLVGEDRHQHGIRHRDQADHSDQEDQREDWFGAADEAEAFDDMFVRRSILGGSAQRFEFHHQQADDDGDIADGVGKEAPAFADARHQNSGDGRADDAGAVEHRGIERDGVHQIFAHDHFDEQRLAGGNVEGVYDAEQSRQRHDFPDANDVQERERGQREGQNHRGYLRADDDFVAIPTIGGETAERSEKKNGNASDETDGAEQERGAGEAVYQPGFGDGLHPGADQGDHLAAEEQLEIAMAERANRFAKTGTIFRGRGAGKGECR